MLIALVTVAQRLPWLFMTLPAGVLADRMDRARLMVLSNGFRTVLTVFVAVVVLVRQGDLPDPDTLAAGVDIDTQVLAYIALLLATLLLGSAEVVYDNAAQTIMPSLVRADQLEKANGRLWSTEEVGNTVVGPLLGSALLAIAFVVPFGFDAATFAISAVLIATLPSAVQRAEALARTTEEPAAAHDAGAHVVVDGVHLTPHAPVDIDAIGCDVYSTSSYKWYGPHAGITWIRPELCDALPAYKVRPAPDTGPERFQLGTPAYENLAAIDAAARFLLDTGMATIQEHERAVFSRLLEGLLADDRVTVHAPHDLIDRAPTLAFNVAGYTAEAVAQALAAERIAVWDGHYYALEAMDALGIDAAVRAGIAVYTTDDDVDRLIGSVARL